MFLGLAVSAVTAFFFYFKEIVCAVIIEDRSVSNVDPVSRTLNKKALKND